LEQVSKKIEVDIVSWVWRAVGWMGVNPFLELLSDVYKGHFLFFHDVDVVGFCEDGQKI
jgi:hypothetical protein